MTVIELVEKQLREMGADGLYNCRGECACLIGDLEPCGRLSGDCEAGIRDPDHDPKHDEFDFVLIGITPQKAA